MSSVAEQPVETRAKFTRKTYTHLAGAIDVFALIEAILLATIPPQGSSACSPGNSHG